MRKIISSPLVFPFLATIYPIIGLYSTNAQLLKFSTTWRSLIVALFVTGLFILFGWFVFKDWTKSGLLALVTVSLFFSYGHVFNILDQLPLGRHRFLLPLWSFLFLFAVWVISKKGSLLKPVVNKLNYFGGVLVMIPFLWVLLSTPLQISSKIPEKEINAVEPSGSIDQEFPDIYYIILDGYARSDVLLNIFDYDNTAFIDYLVSKDFYVADESRSNYMATFLSLASSLNMEYLHDLPEQVGINSKDRSVPYEMIDKNTLSRYLRSQGYKLVNFSSGWGPTDFISFADENYRGGYFNEFEWTLFNTTMLASLNSRIAADDLAKRLKYNFEKLGSVSTRSAPTFVFAHMLIPHPPFLFDSNGNLVDQSIFKLQGDEVWSHKNAYIEQVMFVNKMVERVVDKILNTSDNPPIIILQADHGSASSGGWEDAYQIISMGRSDDASTSLVDERLSIFNAYYLPGNVDSESVLYPSITPVNSFRLILDTYFGESMGLLEDKSYFSDYDHPYQFFEVKP